MYSCGQQVLYGIHGVCTIVELETKTVDRKKIEYYVLEPVFQPGSRYYVPAHNQAAVAKLCPIMTQDELNDILKTNVACQDVWIEDENQRKNHYRSLINSGDRVALLRMVYTLHNRKKEQLASGKKFHLCDENFLRDAQKLLDAEFSVVLNMNQKDVPNYVRTVLCAE